MSGKELLRQVIETCQSCQHKAEALREGGGKTAFLQTLAAQRSQVESLMDRVFFKTPKGANRASIVLESAQKLQETLDNLSLLSDEERGHRWPEAEESLREFAERVEGMIQAAQGKTLAFT